MKRKIAAMGLTMVMTMAMGATAFAASTPSVGADNNFSTNTANTEVNIKGLTDDQMNANLSATVPISVQLAVTSDGRIVSPTNYAITNKSLLKDIKVSKVTATAEAGFDLDGSSTTTTDVDLSVLKLTGGGTQVDMSTMASSAGAVNPTNWTMAMGGTTTLNLTFEGQLEGTSLENLNTVAGAAAQKAFTLEYTIEAN